MRTTPAAGTATILLVEQDDAVRDAMAIRLRRAGFHIRAAGDTRAAAALLVRTRFDVIAGDSLVEQELGKDAAGAFALIRKPVDFEQLVHVVGACARRKEERADLRSLQRFVSNLPALRAALAAPTPSIDELALRGELRRTILELSGALEAAAATEANRIRAAVFLAASVAAADVAAGDAPSGAGH